MDSSPDGSVAVLSIHPEYARLIASGEKKVEFRRNGFSRPLTHVVVYSTSPESRLVGYFEVEDISRGTPEALWDNHNGHSGISREKLFDYFGDEDEVTAITIGSFYEFRETVTLEDLGMTTPPRSFRYVDHEVLAKLGGVTSFFTFP